MTTLFKRVVNVALGPRTPGAVGALAAIERASGIEVSNLDCTFKVKKNLLPKANICELKLFNLSKSSRHALETPARLVVRLEAGYVGAVGQLYLGEIRSAHSSRVGPDIVTEVETGDSEKDLQTSHINLSIGPKVPINVALAAIAREFKNVGLGNVAVVGARLAAKGIAPFGPGSAIFGSAAQAMTDICLSADLEWSIQDGVIQILDRGKAQEGLATLLSPSTGLVGSPTIDHKGIVSFKALLQPNLRPGYKIAFDTFSFKIAQGYRIEEIEYSGDTASTEWYATGKAKKY